MVEKSKLTHYPFLRQLTGTERLVVMLLHGAGLRLEECLELRVKDLDFDRHQIVVRHGKGRTGRTTMLPAAAREALTAHLCARSMERGALGVRSPMDRL